MFMCHILKMIVVDRDANDKSRLPDVRQSAQGNEIAWGFTKLSRHSRLFLL